ncbi:PREDICTED: CBL-interacting serine/threonine-protein kinase 17-like isoform X2 [Brassica oleracea var. oleracea]|uniref:CBL-interacting serine/threonine-protein kinase 17-like isoform X2 n=1 Tax=Brassica oleracea var. oleracea TaxID=109376 RepID=UPI0006A6EC22|nr:PREDICTED: CBL-interacting serine/threonine-protein kinase 17-like isoform X2 [Brassica oleracea var. oleracea]
MVRKGMRVGKYELGRTLGEGNSAKVKLATDTVSGQSFAVKIIDKSSIKRLNVSFQIKREIRTLKVLKHPNIVRLNEVLASKTKIYMVLECVTGGDLFDRIVSRGKLSETEGRTLFQQLIDGVSYCHNKGVFHRDLKLENVLLDAKGHIKITDFGLSALPQHFRIFKGDPPIPRWLSPGAKTMIKRMLDPNPITRMTIAGIKANDWFNNGYTPSNSDDEDDASSIQEDMVKVSEEEKNHDSPIVINAFELIGMSSFLDLSGLFETEKVSDRQIRFTSNRLAIDVLEKIKTNLMEMGFYVQKKQTMLKAIQQESNRKGQSGLSLTAEVFGIVPLLNVVELRKTHGDSLLYEQLCDRLSNELGTSSQVQ